MCCFSGPVSRVSDTCIFARLDADHQLLAYQMKVAAPGAVAMVLPIPTPPSTSPDAVRFIDLSAEPWLFDELRFAFEVSGDGASLGTPAAAAEGSALEVHRVGAFEASFVPSPSDFARLDARFRLPEGVLGAVPHYADWDFVVFKLRVDEGRETDFHPMAFRFPTRRPGEAFFPCLHVHDGEVHPTADFDHQLYAQLGPGRSAGGWQRSDGVLGRSGAPSRVVDGQQLAFYRRVEGSQPNGDVWLAAVAEPAADAKLRETSQRERAEAAREAAQYAAKSARQELVGRIARAVIATPVAALLGFFVFISDPFATRVFALAWLPAVWVAAQALTGRARWALIATAIAAAAAAANLVYPAV